MYDRPMMTLRLDGSLHCLHDATALRAFYTSALAGYVATGYETASLTVDREAPLGPSAAIADITWTLRRSPDVVVLRFAQSYNVRRTETGWKIYASTMHSPAK